MKVFYLIKTEGETVKFVTMGEYGTVYLKKAPGTITEQDLEFFSTELFETEPRKMIGMGGEHDSLPHNVHRLSECWNEKPEAVFELRLVEVDFVKQTFTNITVWNYDVKQWPEGHVRITETATLAA